MKFTQSQKSWTEINAIGLKMEQQDKVNGMSYIISGGLALVGGIAGSNVTSDPLEKGVYALFQTIGIASIGYGSYKMYIGNEERLLLRTLRDSNDLNETQKISFLRTYYSKKQELEKNERIIKAITHGLISALNFYNANQQKQEGVKNTLNFIGGANFLASLSYTF
jgi:hypothetical protein